MTLYNCHTHIFTNRVLPDKFLPFGIDKAINHDWVAKSFLWLAENIVPFSKVDIGDRVGRFAKAALKKDQAQVLEQLISYYPEDSKFVVLPMDMDFMGYGKMPQSIEDQHDELLRLKSEPKFGSRILPFVHFDPRRPNSTGLIRSYIEKGFIGIKLYPNLGYGPNDKLLTGTWELANEKRLPVIVHCSRGGVKKKDSTKEERDEWSKPEAYRDVLLKYPNMKLCLGHFGGDDDWSIYLESNGKENSWLKTITDMMREPKSGEKLFPNLYADISYSVFNFERNAKVLKVLLTDKDILEHTLFGSDFYMAEQEKFGEKLLSMYLRAELGEDIFWQIANTNPREYLGSSVLEP